eukprot:SAG11_NODE_237_length_11835_cov_11.023347_5_plen_51_part_00
MALYRVRRLLSWVHHPCSVSLLLIYTAANITSMLLSWSQLLVLHAPQFGL